jgi:cytochrome c oxidase accessory protein FixG
METSNQEPASNKVERPYFRDLLPTVDEKGGRRWIYPKKPKGKIYTIRWFVSIILLVFFFTAPFITVNGEPFILLNVLERKFILFGQLFWPQDFHLLVLSLISFLVFLILFTVIFGRIFCGWICPQTVFMEFVFRQIEYLIEGNAHQQRKLDQREWDLDKIWRKTLKHTLFFILSFAIINTIYAYIVGVTRVSEVINAGPAAHFGTFLTLLIFSVLVYFIYGHFREQLCILICPYGRLQGVLLDNKSIVVAYDYKRGEPRAPLVAGEKRGENQKGDCVDCNSCVDVCPTGIDIRNGTQLECINCAACIDACNKVMKRVDLPKGLVRYDSENGITTGVKQLLNARSVAYSAILVVLLVIVTSMFVMRGEVEATILRMPGSMFQEYGPGAFSNIYKIQLVNKADTNMPISLKLLSHEGQIVFIGNEIEALKGEVTEATFMVVIGRDKIFSSNTPLVVGIFSGDKQIDVYKTNFIGPNNLDNK